jgi:hypothetical protein
VLFAGGDVLLDEGFNRGRQAEAVGPGDFYVARFGGVLSGCALGDDSQGLRI